MIVAPIETLDLMISDIVSEVRKGISGARIANQINPDAGMMADLPEFIEFEVQVIGNYRTSANVVISGRQILSRSSNSLDVGLTFDGSGEVEVGNGTDRDNDSDTDESRNTTTSTSTDRSDSSDQSTDTDITAGVTKTTTSNNGKDTEGETKGGRSQRESKKDSKTSSRDTNVVAKEDVDSEKVIDSKDETKSGKREQVGVGQGTRNQKKNLKLIRSRNANTASNAARGYGNLETETGVFTDQGSFIGAFRDAPIAGEAECNPVI